MGLVSNLGRKTLAQSLHFERQAVGLGAGLDSARMYQHWLCFGLAGFVDLAAGIEPDLGLLSADR